ncbi:MAG TPA: glutamate racemase, partial [Pseudomonas sp.]|nr:glutamate racemase [Pseudomonas sp.]
LPGDVRLIDTGAAVARHLHELLAERHLLSSGEASQRFYCSGDPQRMSGVLPTLWGEHAEVELFSR